MKLTPELLVDLGLRAGSRGRLSLAKLKRHPHGLVLAETHRTGRLRRVVHHGGRHPHKVRLDAPEISQELAALAAQVDDPAYPLRLIGLRELRSHNSWMHNAPTLMKGKRSHGMRIHPKDAADLGIEDGQVCAVASRHGEIELPAMVTEDVSVGTVAVPHGWGHDGGWTRANAAGGANVNALASTDPADLERLAGMAFLNGIPVRVGPALSPGVTATMAALPRPSTLTVATTVPRWTAFSSASASSCGRNQLSMPQRICQYRSSQRR